MELLIKFYSKNPAIDLSDEDHGEISGEFGDSTSMSNRVKDVITASEGAHPPLPPEDETPATFRDYISVFKSNHMKALIWKNFLWMWRNVGYKLKFQKFYVTNCNPILYPQCYVVCDRSALFANYFILLGNWSRSNWTTFGYCQL